MIFLSVLILVNLSFLKAETCGNVAFSSGLVVNGLQVLRGQFPFLVALHKVENDKFFCAANLISNRHAITGLR